MLMKDIETENEVPFSAVLEAVSDADPINIATLYRLSDMSNSDSAAFFETWSTLSVERRRLVMQHLADIMEDNFEVEFGPIFRHGLEDNDSKVRRAALEGLWDSSDTKLVPSIVRILDNDESEEVRVAAARSLAHYIMMIEWGQLQERAKPAIVTALLTHWDRPDATLELKRAVLEAISASGHERVEKMIGEAYSSRQLELQVSALFAMGNTADPQWISTLTDEMESPYDEVRAEAARAAGNIGRSDVVEQLRHMVDDPEAEVQFAVVEALGQIGSEEATEILNAILEDEDAEFLHEAVEEALAEMAIFQLADFSLFDMDDDVEHIEGDEGDLIA